MRISPLDIRQQQFTVKMLRGFDPHEVDAFLDDVAEDYEAVLRENALLKEQLITLEERSRGVADREKAIQDTLVATQRLGDEMKAAARREAELHMREAELHGEKVLEGARSEEADPERDSNAPAHASPARRGPALDARELLSHDGGRVR